MSTVITESKILKASPLVPHEVSMFFDYSLFDNFSVFGGNKEAGEKKDTRDYLVQLGLVVEPSSHDYHYSVTFPRGWTFAETSDGSVSRRYFSPDGKFVFSSSSDERPGWRHYSLHKY